MRGVGKFVALPFFSGCASRSSVATAISLSTTNQFQEHRNSEINPTRREESENVISPEKIKSSTGFAIFPNLSIGVQKLVRSIKSFSQFFVLKKEEEEKVEMEIGYPTDVKHVTHIGLDGCCTNPNSSLMAVPLPPEILSFPSISLTQFQLSMAAQTLPHHHLLHDDKPIS